MAYEIEGTIKVIFETQTFSSGFTKREFVVTTDEKFPQDIKIECVKERVELLDPFQERDRVKVSFNLRGNEYKDRYFVNLQAWKIEKPSDESATAPEGDRPPLPSDDAAPDNEDDFPF